MSPIAILSLTLLCPTSTQSDAKQLAQEILNQGSALFDTRDAAAMAATYTEDAQGTIFSKDETTGQIKAEMTPGRAAIQKGYEDLFKMREAGTISRNTVDFARLAGDDMLIIQGTFTVDTRDPGSAIPFVQVRVKRGDKWLILSLQLFVSPH